LKIAFDLDDTLIPTTVLFSCGARGAKFPFNLFFKEPLRLGAVELLNQIYAEHELWIYTTSLRPPLEVKLWLYSFGIKVHGVINADIHSVCVKRTPYQNYSKAPKLFGIDYLIDDSKGVQMECEAQGVSCILVSFDDNQWVEKISSNVLTGLKAAEI
jgi:hypothetical protein